MRAKIMLPQRRGHGTNNRQLLDQPCRPRQEIGDVDPWNTRLDHLEGPPYFLRGMRLRIECLQVAWASVEPDQDAPLRTPPEPRPGILSRQLPGGQAECRERPQLEHLAPRDSITSTSPVMFPLSPLRLPPLHP